MDICPGVAELAWWWWWASGAARVGVLGEISLPAAYHQILDLQFILVCSILGIPPNFTFHIKSLLEEELFIATQLDKGKLTESIVKIQMPSRYSMLVFQPTIGHNSPCRYRTSRFECGIKRTKGRQNKWLLKTKLVKLVFVL